ncbi:Sec39 domain-containing protein [Bombardia bombarda]|uniref:Sec39 domain-containing protein n=1 Tax=Bombardia bombarda TaxID=252184 RepID=A0AA39XJH6_9PEZI|nr:Sec39 domain-containing protein [Bombardia bombarda]
MALHLSPPKLVLLAVHLAVKADIDNLTALASHHGSILRKDLLLRILLTYLPEALRTSAYVGFIQNIHNGAFPEVDTKGIDCSSVEGLTEDAAKKKVKKLRLLPLTFPEAPKEAAEDSTTLFLFRRSYRVDEESGLLRELPALLTPFLELSPCLRTFLVSAILPLLRRNCEYYPQNPIPHTLLEFQQLPERVAADLLLSQTGAREEDLSLIGRDLRGLIAPWRFTRRRGKDSRQDLTVNDEPGSEDDGGAQEGAFPGWDQVLQWLTAHASKNWKVAVGAIEQWNGPEDADLGGWAALSFSYHERIHLEQTWARASLASAYLIPEASNLALEGAYNIVAHIASLLDQDHLSPLENAVAILPPLAEHITRAIASPRNATYMRNDLLEDSNVLTSPTPESTAFLRALILSAFLLTRAGSPCTLRRAGELALLEDERDQRAEATKLIHVLANNGPKTDDKFWIKARNEILWLRDWGVEDSWGESEPDVKGIFGQLKKENIETEILKALLTNTRYSLARLMYEDSPDQPLDRKVLQDTIYATAMTAYDNASNPNRTRGGLKKCDEILKAFPKTIQKYDVDAQRIEALLQATHALSEFRLVLKQGEPFTPVVLRVHKDPISIIDKILEQNPKSYTRLHDLLDLGARMVQAGLTTRDKPGQCHHVVISPEEEATQRVTAERRITAMCVDAALTEDDFETAYSYVVNRLISPSKKTTTDATIEDDYSWKAALQAGKYRRTARTVRPTHIGTASGNPEIRHLEQRIECLSTALRIAPSPTLQEILNAFRRAEEELDAAIKAEAEQEDAWDAAGDSIHMPGGFNPPSNNKPSTSTAGASTASAVRPASSSRHHQTEEAPMSLFDLSRASVLSAQRNLTALSSLQRAIGKPSPSPSSPPPPSAGGRSSLDQAPGSNASDNEDGQPKRARKRDQLREAAMGTLVSGVGWLISAPVPPADKE